MEEVQRLRGELAEERRKGTLREEDDEVVGKYWHPVANWDYYEAVNSSPSSASDHSHSDQEDEEEEGEEEEEEEEQEEISEQEDRECHDFDDDDVDNDDADSRADDEGDSESDLSQSDNQSTISSPLQHSPSLSRTPHTPTSADSQCDSLSTQLAATSLHSVKKLTALSAEEDEGEDGEDDEDDDSHQSSTNSSLASSPQFSDVFPFERNLYLLSRHYHFHHRLYSCPDAVTFKATHIASSQLCVIKISEGFSATRSHPKEIRVLTRAQGHPNVMKLRGWYGLEMTGCYAFVSDWVENVGVNRVWGEEVGRRKYMRDLLEGLYHLHSRGVLYRDVKPSNVLWNERECKATIIDYDVATYYDPHRLHRSVVGTNGYMAPEMTRKGGGEDEEGDGYTQQVDVYSAGIVLGQLLFQIHEDEVADMSRPETKGPAMVNRVLKWAGEHGGRIGAEYHLLLRMLTEDPQLRITVKDALQHPYFTQK